MIINGKQIADEVLAELKKEVAALRQAQGKSLRLAAVLVGEDQALKKFVELKGKIAEDIGISFKMHQFPQNIPSDELVKKVKEIADENDGALVELPLPKHIDTQAVLDAVPVEKDVDVLSTEAQARFHEVQPIEVGPPKKDRPQERILPPAVEATKIVFEKFSIELKGKKVAVFGQGILVGEPISDWLERQGAEVFRINSKTEKPEELSRQADIIVSGVGKPELVNGEMVKPARPDARLNDTVGQDSGRSGGEGVVVIDFGYGRNKEGKMVGDVDYDSVEPKSSLITPVPGGMGPVLIAAVLKNLVKLNS